MNLITPADAVRRIDLDADPALSDTLPGWVYTDPEVLAEERTRLFFRTWHYAGCVSQLREAGDYITARLLDQSILIMRGRDGALRGFYNVCQHRAHELLEGTGNARVVTCPYHAWSFHDDGSLRTARGAERQPGFDPDRFCLKQVRVEVFAGRFVFFNLDPDAVGLAAQTPGLAEEIAAETPHFAELAPEAAPSGQEIGANWKVVLDNFHECYHCGPAHPAFTDLLDMACYRTTTHAIWSKQAGSLGRADNKAYPVEPDEIQTAAFWWIWPTTTISYMPGTPGLTVTSNLPLGAGRSVRLFHPYTLAGRPPDPRKVAYGRDVLGPEDVVICESVQRGLSSRGYTAGRFVHDPEGGQTTEAAVHLFHRLYVAAMGYGG
jgi:choline monooxygenase